MALKTCEDCKKEISTLAVSCPNCGRPNQNAGIVTIEQTQKKYKEKGLFGGCLMLIAIGCGGTLLEAGVKSRGALFVPFAIFAIGFMYWIKSGIGKWYHHG